MKYIFTMLFLFLFMFTLNGFAQWQFWEANDLPDTTGTPWIFDAESGEITFSSIVDDPDIPGNKLLQFASTASPRDEVWRYEWAAGVETGATLVIRMKAIEGEFDRHWDIYIQNGEYRERTISTGYNRIKFDKSDQEISDFGMDLREWHIYRFTIIEGFVDLYIDEDPLGWLSASGSNDANGGNYFQFGDNGGDTYGTMYDWIAWDVSGAYPPGEGDPLPPVLTGHEGTAIEQISTVVPEKFELLQNFPNPFNPVTDIRFNLKKATDVLINVYDSNGKQIRTLVDQRKPAGQYSVQWNGLDDHGQSVASGIYFYRMKAGNSVLSRKMALLK